MKARRWATTSADRLSAFAHVRPSVAFFASARKRFALSLRPKSENAPRRTRVRGTRTLRNDGASTAPLEWRRGYCPPSFRVPMPGSPPNVRNAACANARTDIRLARAPFLRHRLGAAASPEQALSSFFIFPTFGAPRLDFERPSRAPEAACARLMRVSHVQQDDHRCVPPGRDPGGCPQG